MAHDMNHHERQIYEKLYELMGVKVRIESDNIIYQGIIGAIITELCLVNIRHTSEIGGEYLGNTRFRFRDITSVVRFQEEFFDYSKKDGPSDILKNKSGRKYDPKDIPCNQQFSNSSVNETLVSVKPRETKYVLKLPPYLVSVLPCDSIIIDSLDAIFTEAIRQIFKERVIGVSFHGPVISRLGNLTSVCISTSSKIYLFDILRLQSEAFDNGLRDIFEDESIKKVIHDCRFPSDCLAHQYSTQLVNVFDTQVADFIVSIQHHHGKHELNFVTPLKFCLRNHLDIPPEFLYKHVFHQSEGKCAYFTKRPISNEVKDDLLNSAIYLILLYQVLSKKLLDPFHKTVDSYLRVLANATVEETNTVGDLISQPDCIPPSLLMYGIQTARYRELNKQDVISLALKFKVSTTRAVVKSKPTCCGAIYEKCKNSSTSEKKLIHELFLKYCNEHQQESKDQERTLLGMISVESIISHAEKEYKILSSISEKPRIRQFSEIYRKLVDKHNLISHNSKSKNNIKLLDKQKSILGYETSSSHMLGNQKSVHSMGFKRENLCTTETVPVMNDSTNFKAKLKNKSNFFDRTSSCKGKCKPIFIPA